MTAQDPRERVAEQAAIIGRTYRGSFAVLLAALAVSLQWVSLPISFGVVAGYLLGAGVLLFWQKVVGAAFRPERPRPALAGVLLLVKLPVMGALVWFLLSRGLVHPWSFAFGCAIPQLTMMLLAFGRVGRREGSKRGPTRVAPRAESV